MALARGGQTLLSDAAQAEAGKPHPDGDTEVLSHGHYPPRRAWKSRSRCSSCGAEQHRRPFVPPRRHRQGAIAWCASDDIVAAGARRAPQPAGRARQLRRPRARAARASPRSCDAGARLLTVLGVGGTGKTRLVRRYGRDVRSATGPAACTSATCPRRARSTASTSPSRPRSTCRLGRDDPAVQLGHAIAGRGPLPGDPRQLRAGAVAHAAANRRRAGSTAHRTQRSWSPAASACIWPARTCCRSSRCRSTNEAIELFASCAPRRSGPASCSTPPTATPVAEIVRLLDGLPLAIELAAARMRRAARRAAAASA